MLRIREGNYYTLRILKALASRTKFLIISKDSSLAYIIDKNNIDNSMDLRNFRYELHKFILNNNLNNNDKIKITIGNDALNQGFYFMVVKK